MPKKYQIFFDDTTLLIQRKDEEFSQSFYLVNYDEDYSYDVNLVKTIFTKNELKEYLEYKKQDQVSRKEVRSFIRTFGVEV